LYIAAINNLSIAYGKAKLYGMRMKSISKLKVFIDANDDIIDKTTKATSILNVLDATLSTYLITDKIEKALSLEYEIIDAINKYSKDAPLTNSLDLMYNMAYTFFDAKKFEKSLDWLNKIISMYQAGYRDDLFIACRLLSLIIHFELKNEYYLESSIESTTKYISNKKRLTYSEQALLIFLKKTTKAKSESNTISALKELQHKINKTPRGKKDNIISYIDIQQWASEKLKEMQYNKV
jgi:tetratricopeptide (TPR) repeat protein